MKHPIFKTVVLGALLLWGIPPAIRAQSFSVDWFVAAGGGGSCAGGGFSLEGTFGQSDATEQPLTAAEFSLTGGFWSLFAPVDGSVPVPAERRNYVTIEALPASDGTASGNGDAASLRSSASAEQRAFASAAGTYQGLFYSPNGVALDSSGFIEARVTAGGTFSAKLQFASSATSLAGRFSPAGLFSNSVAGPAAEAMSVQLQMDAGNSILTGQISGGRWTADLRANRAVFSAANSAREAGLYTIKIPSEGNLARDGLGVVVVDASGHITFRGTLGDGAGAGAAAVLGGQGQWPMFVPLYAGRGSVLGWLTFSHTVESDVSGTLNWIKPGETNTIFASGSTYRP